MSRYAKASADVGGTAGEPAYTGCGAYGCPMPGALSDSTHGSDRWTCRFHFGVASREWDRVTTGIRQKLGAGIPLDPTEPTPTVKAMLERVRKPAKVVA